MHDPNVGDRREATPATNGFLVHGISRRASGWSSHFLIRQRAVSLADRERTLMAGKYRWPARYIARSTKRPGGPRRRRASRVPQREPALPTETAREQSTRGQGRSSFAGAGSQPSCAPGTGCIRERYPEELRDWSSWCYHSLPLRLL